MNYETLVHLKKSLTSIHAFEVDQSVVDPLFLAHMLENHPFDEPGKNQISRFSFSLIWLLDSVRDYTNSLNRFFSSLYSLSDDHLLIRSLVEIASKVKESPTQAKVDLDH